MERDARGAHGYCPHPCSVLRLLPWRATIAASHVGRAGEGETFGASAAAACPRQHASHYPVPLPSLPSLRFRRPADASMQPAAKVESSSKQVAAAKLKISDAHLLAVVKLVHGSARSKNDLVQELIQVQPDIPKSRGEKIIATVAQKKVEKGASRWVLLEETLKRSAFIAEIAKEAWKANTSKPPAKKATAAAPPSGGAASGTAEPAAPPISV